MRSCCFGNGTSYKIGNEEVHYLNEKEQDQMEVEGYRVSRAYWLLTWCGILMTLGTLQFVFYWYPRLYLVSTHKKCSLREATKVLVTEMYKNLKMHYVINIKEGSIFDGREGLKLSDINQACNGDSENTEDYNLDTATQSVRVFFNNGYSKDISDYRLFLVKKLTYIWVEEKSRFLKLSGLGPGMKYSELHNYRNLDSTLQEHLKKLYGANEINVQVQSYVTLFFVEVISPYYFFQVFSITIWIIDNYLYYTYAIIVVSVFGITLTIIQTHRAQTKLKETVESSDASTVEIVSFDGTIVEAKCRDLVPGNRIIVPHNEEFIMPCDAVILSGSCIVQESMLTGESVPLTKTSLPNRDEYYAKQESSNHSLFCGTTVIQTRQDGGERVVALVTRTGFATAKGDLVRAILYPPPVDYVFEQSVYTFINLSAIAAFLLSCGVAVWLVFMKIPPLQVFIRAFELVTMVIPAAIPGSLTLSKVYAVQRFKRNQISCVNTKVINVAGSINCVCFDKTGTITEDGLDIWGVVPTTEGRFEVPVNDPSGLDNSSLKFALASCHSLSLNQDKIIGDPLDKKMFESTNWLFEEIKNDDGPGFNGGPMVYPDVARQDLLNIRLVHQNQFVSNLQRMSMVAKRSNASTFELYCKGSPEVIASLSRSETVPSNLDEVLQRYTKKGYRVLALAWKTLDDIPLEIFKQRPRSEMETNLEFLGLLVLMNKVKAASKPVIDELKGGKFKVIMITGDNIQTAISVSRECKIIEDTEDLFEVKEEGGKLVCVLNQQDRDDTEIKATEKRGLKELEEGHSAKLYKMALTGAAWEIIRTQHLEYLPRILVRTAVFARMTSKQKHQVVTELQNLEYCVAMCGDGANDCAALKAANVGVSLSEAEASVASPLCSAKEDISCIPAVIREGRSALVTSFGLIKFILSYGYIQMMSTMINYGFLSNLSDFEYIWEDIFLVILYSLFFGLTEAFDGEIVSVTPIMKMLSLIPVLSIGIHTSIFVFFQLLSYFWIQSFSWFVNGTIDEGLAQPDEYMISYTYKNYAVYSVSVFQIITSAIIFSKSYPYRKPIYTNYLFSLALVVTTVLTILITTYPGKWVQQLFVLALPPLQCRLSILVIVFINFLISYATEVFIIEYFVSKVIMNSSIFEKNKKNKYQIALQQTTDMQWLMKIANVLTDIDNRK